LEKIQETRNPPLCPRGPESPMLGPEEQPPPPHPHIKQLSRIPQNQICLDI
jgi:hypothetical protein